MKEKSKKLKEEVMHEKHQGTSEESMRRKAARNWARKYAKKQQGTQQESIQENHRRITNDIMLKSQVTIGMSVRKKAAIT